MTGPGRGLYVLVGAVAGLMVMAFVAGCAVPAMDGPLALVPVGAVLGGLVGAWLGGRAWRSERNRETEVRR